MAYPKDLSGTVALIVGGAGAIGAATGRMLAEAGATIVVTHMPGAEFERAAAEVIGRLPGGRDHAAYPADVVDSASLVALRGEIERRYGRLRMPISTRSTTPSSTACSRSTGVASSPRSAALRRS